MVDIKDAMAKAELLGQANPASLAALAPWAFIRPLGKGEFLYRDKEQVHSFYFVIEGQLSIYKINSNGEKKVIFILGAGKILNEESIHAYPSSCHCEALTETKVLAFPRAEFIEVMKSDFNLSKAFMDAMAIKLRRLYRQMKNTTGSLRGDKKLAAKLWKLSKDYGVQEPDGTHINLSITVTGLAEMIGDKRETVSRHLKVLLAQGLVLRKNNTLIIPSRDKLKDYFKYSEIN